MNKKLAIILSIFTTIVFSFSICFANDMMKDATNGIQNVVGGAENAVKNVANDVSNASKSATNSIESTANNMTNNIMTNGDNHNTAKDTNNETFTGMNQNYDVTRTSAEGSTLMGMGATTWTWLIIGLAAIAIVALVWYYSTQIRSSHYDDKE